MAKRSEKYEDMPYQMGEFEPVEGVKQGSDRVGDAPRQNQPKGFRGSIIQGPDQGHAAPPQQQKQREVQNGKFADFNGFENHSHSNDGPLDPQQNPSKRFFDDQNENRREGSSNQEVNRDMVETLKNFLTAPPSGKA